MEFLLFGKVLVSPSGLELGFVFGLLGGLGLLDFGDGGEKLEPVLLGSKDLGVDDEALLFADDAFCEVGFLEMGIEVRHAVFKQDSEGANNYAATNDSVK